MVLMRITGYHGFDLPQDDGATKTQMAAAVAGLLRWFLAKTKTRFCAKHVFFNPASTSAR